MKCLPTPSLIRYVTACLGLAIVLALPGAQVLAQQISAFQQVLASAVADDKAVAEFYRANGYKAIWTGKTGRDRARRVAFFEALAQAPAHGLSSGKYDPKGLKAKLKTARTQADRARAEANLSKVFVEYASDIQTGMLTPSRVVPDIHRAVPYRDRTSYLTNFVKSSPRGFLRSLPPQTAQYRALMKNKLILERGLGAGGWGATVKAKKLEPGQSGASVVALRNRLISMGYLKRTASQSYDAAMQKAVQAFQLDHGLAADGVAGPGTIKEINVPMEKRLQSIIVAMERERWINMPLGKRHIWVNLPDFTAKVVDNGKVTFQTRAVVGANKHDRRSPEFSDQMEFMMINPTWNVPRSIVTKEYLPALQKNPNAVRHLVITDSRGRRVSRDAVDFTQFTARSFPYAMSQPPSNRNALGLVKFMFPNKYNIYLHDTPQKSLFSREARAYSHGCIRLNDPFDFAYTLLAKQTNDPKGTFHRALDSGRETKIDLNKAIPVHIVYRTALADERGAIEYRRDIYGRDAKLWSALAAQGVVLRAVRG
ncbi:MAG: L,D-transpeptidase family protein [Marinibacterium sp.]